MTIQGVLDGHMRWHVAEGDCIQWMRSMPDASVDAIVCDPPAGISFMGKTWDSDKGGPFRWIRWLARVMREARRVLKPGGHALVWALPRTSAWTGMALQLAGFEIRDVITHMFGSGFPKSLNVSKAINKAAPDTAAAWEGWGTALKPAAEFWFLVRKAPKGSIARNVLEHGTGALNIDGCRVEHASAEDFAAHADQVATIKARGGSMDNSWKNSSDLSGASDASALGRWPAHVLLSHAEGCERVGVRKVKASTPWAKNDRPPLFTGEDVSPIHYGDGDGMETVEHWRCAEGCPVAMLDEQSGSSTSPPIGNTINIKAHDGFAGEAFAIRARESVNGHGDTGGASRYFTTFAPFLYMPKADRADREKGCEYMPRRSGGELTGRKDGSAGLDSPRAGAGRRGGRKNDHPTVKPAELMRWLVRLITPPNGLVLDMFCGSGSTGVACSAEGFRFIGIELDPHYVEIARARILGDAPLFNAEAMR